MLKVAPASWSYTKKNQMYTGTDQRFYIIDKYDLIDKYVWEVGMALDFVLFRDIPETHPRSRQIPVVLAVW